MHVFYIPDGHRRFAEKTGCTLQFAYREGMRVLLNEIVDPLFAIPEVAGLDVFCLSNLNLQRRDNSELQSFLREGEVFVQSLVKHCASYASIRTVGSYFAENIYVRTVSHRLITLVVGCTTDDDVDCGPVDLFIRSGGQLRLSGAPRSIIGNYTEFYSVEEVHPLVRFSHIATCLNHFSNRYRRVSDRA